MCEVVCHLHNYDNLCSLDKKGTRDRFLRDTTCNFFNWNKDISALQLDPKSVKIWAKEADPLFRPVSMRGHVGNSVEGYFTW